MQATFQLARERITTISLIIGEVVGSVIALSFYFTFFIPFALIALAGKDPLRRKIIGDPQWLDREPISTELDRAKRQG